MPAPIVPPPISDVGAFTIPRTLQRWLDVNPVTKLDRISTYIVLLPFNIQCEAWAGYSDLVATINFEGPNNFVLVDAKLNAALNNGGVNQNPNDGSNGNVITNGIVIVN